jgi:predicted lactoylglutathione lyase
MTYKALNSTPIHDSVTELYQFVSTFSLLLSTDEFTQAIQREYLSQSQNLSAATIVAEFKSSQACEITIQHTKKKGIINAATKPLNNSLQEQLATIKLQ